MEIKVIFPSLWNRTQPLFSCWLKAKKTGDLGLEGMNQTEVRSTSRGMVLLQVRAIGWRGVWHWNDCTVCGFCAWVCFDQCLCFSQAWCFVEILLTQESSSTRLLSMSEAQALTADKPIRGPFDPRPGVMHLSPLPSQSRSEGVQHVSYSHDLLRTCVGLYIDLAYGDQVCSVYPFLPFYPLS